MGGGVSGGPLAAAAAAGAVWGRGERPGVAVAGRGLACCSTKPGADAGGRGTGGQKLCCRDDNHTRYTRTTLWRRSLFSCHYYPAATTTSIFRWKQTKRSLYNKRSIIQRRVGCVAVVVLICYNCCENGTQTGPPPKESFAFLLHHGVWVSAFMSF